MKTVLITMKSRQQTPENDEATELVTMGTCIREEDGALVLSYEDTDATGFAGSTTTIRVAERELVTILRTGAANSNLTLEIGKKHFCLYSTPYGDMTVGVQAHRIAFEENASGGSIEMEYTVDINAVFMSDNYLMLQWQMRTDRTEETGKISPGESGYVSSKR